MQPPTQPPTQPYATQPYATQRAFQLPRLTPIMVCSLSVASSRGRRPQPPTAGSSANLLLVTAPGGGGRKRGHPRPERHIS